MILSFKGFIPIIHPSAYIHPLAQVIGNVIIGANVFIGAGASLRGDWGKIIIDDGSNVQENCIIHMFPGSQSHLHTNTHVGHGAIIHGAEIGEESLIGMNSVIMDNACIGKECIIGAMTFIPERTKIEPRSLIVGNPYRKIKDVSDEMIKWKMKGTLLYQTLPYDMQNYVKEVEPLRQIPENQPNQEVLFENWKAIHNS